MIACGQNADCQPHQQLRHGSGDWQPACIPRECSSTFKESRLFPESQTGSETGPLALFCKGRVVQWLMARLLALFDFLFGCRHEHLSRVFTLGGETYRVCCDCGARYRYSLATMSIEDRLPLTAVPTRLASLEKDAEVFAPHWAAHRS